MNFLKNKLVIAGIVLFVFLLLLIVIFSSLFRKKSAEGPEPTPIALDNVESSKSVGEVKLKKQSDDLLPEQKELFDAFKSKTPYNSDNLEIGYSNYLDAFLVHEKTASGQAELDKLLADNSLLVFSRNNRGFFEFVSTDVRRIINTSEKPSADDLGGPGSGGSGSKQPTNEQQKNIDLLTLLFEAMNQPTSTPTPPPAATPTLEPPPPPPPGTGSWVQQYGNVPRNMERATKLRDYIQRRWPDAQYAGNCNCRHQRGTGSDPTRWSVHSWCGAIDFFGRTHSPNDSVTRAIYSWANSSSGKTAGIEFALIDTSPGDVHVQIIPNQPRGIDPPCAGG